MPHKTNGRFPWERDKKMKAAAYYRDLDATRFLPYEEKFAGLLGMCEQAKKGEFEVVVVAKPEIQGCASVSWPTHRSSPYRRLRERGEKLSEDIPRTGCAAVLAFRRSGGRGRD